MSKDDIKSEVEKLEAGFLFKHLGIETYQKGESPDFTFVYEGKRMGLEHTNWFPTRKTIDNNAWQKYAQLIEVEVNKSDLPPRIILYSVRTHDDGKKHYKEIAREILDGYKYMIENGINHIDEWEDYEFHLNKLTYVSYYPAATPEQFILSEMQGGVVNEKDLTTLTDTIRKKEKKLMDYRKDPKNNDIQEYWLSVYIPVQEFCIADGDTAPFKNSIYDRIYLVNGKYHLDKYQDDKLGIMRIK